MVRRLFTHSTWDRGRFPAVTGIIQDRAVVLVQIGVGNQQSTSTMQSVLKRYQPRRVVLLGYAGGLDPRLETGAIVEATAIIELPDRKHSIPPMDSTACTQGMPGKFNWQGPILCIDRTLGMAIDKSAAFADTAALVVEMESAGVRRACQEAGVNLKVVRVVLDPAGEDLPDFMGRLIRPCGNLAWRRLLTEAVLRPDRWPTLRRFSANRRQADQALVQAARRLLVGPA